MVLEYSASLPFSMILSPRVHRSYVGYYSGEYMIIRYLDPEGFLTGKPLKRGHNGSIWGTHNLPLPKQEDTEVLTIRRVLTLNPHGATV